MRVLDTLFGAFWGSSPEQQDTDDDGATTTQSLGDALLATRRQRRAEVPLIVILTISALVFATFMLYSSPFGGGGKRFIGGHLYRSPRYKQFQQTIGVWLSVSVLYHLPWTGTGRQGDLRAALTTLLTFLLASVTVLVGVEACYRFVWRRLRRYTRSGPDKYYAKRYARNFRGVAWSSCRKGAILSAACALYYQHCGRNDDGSQANRDDAVCTTLAALSSEFWPSPGLPTASPVAAAAADADVDAVAANAVYMPSPFSPRSPVFTLWATGIALFVTNYAMERTDAFMAGQGLLARRRTSTLHRPRARRPGKLNGNANPANAANAGAGNANANPTDDAPSDSPDTVRRRQRFARLRHAPSAAGALKNTTLRSLPRFTSTPLGGAVGSKRSSIGTDLVRATSTAGGAGAGAGGPGGSGGGGRGGHASEPRHFLPMAHWFNIALAQTAYEVLISTKIFLGRFDIRVLQAAFHQRQHDGTSVADGARDAVDGDDGATTSSSEEDTTTTDDDDDDDATTSDERGATAPPPEDASAAHARDLRRRAEESEARRSARGDTP